MWNELKKPSGIFLFIEQSNFPVCSIIQIDRLFKILKSNIAHDITDHKLKAILIMWMDVQK